VTPPDRPSITSEVVVRFAAYREQHPAWGSLHVVLDDGNAETKFVQECADDADARGDVEGAALARILLTLTESQRLRVGRRAEAVVPPYRPTMSVTLGRVAEDRP